MQLTEARSDIAEALPGLQRFIDPLRKDRQLRQPAFDRPPQHLGGQSGGHGINGFHKWQVFGLGKFHHEIRMHHGGAAIEPVHLAADENLLIDRQRLGQPVALGAEEGQRQFAGLVMQEDAIGRGAVSRRWRLVAVHSSLNGDNGAGCGKRDAGAVAAVDDVGRRVEQEINHAGVVGVFPAQELGQKIGKLRPHTGKGGDGSKQRIENGRAHGQQNRGRARLMQDFAGHKGGLSPAVFSGRGIISIKTGSQAFASCSIGGRSQHPVE
ncbi:hypothetical protein D3C86_1173930 [compost metagenome]